MPAMRLSEAHLEPSDVGVLVCGVHPCGGGFVGGGQVGVPKGSPALRGPQLRGVGGMCQVEECAEWVRCSFPSAEGGIEPAASDSEVGCYLLWCCLGGRELWVWEMEVTAVEIRGEKDVAGRHVQAAPAVAQGRAVGGQGCAARGNGYVPHVVCRIRHVIPSQVVPEGVGEWPEEAGVAGGGVCGWGCGPRAVVKVEFPAVGTVGEAVCGS